MATKLLALARAIKEPVIKAGKAYVAVAERRPLMTGVVTTLIKTSAADLFAQKVIEQRKEVDMRRHAMFCSFGFFYLGGFQYYLYNHLFARWCGSITAAFGHKASAPVKVFIDQCIHHPLLYFPTFYTLKGMVAGQPWQVSLDKYAEDLWPNLKALWMLWVPAQLVNFSVVPMHLRIPFVAGVSFAWTVIISVMRGALESSDAQGAAAAATASASAAVEHATQASGELLRSTAVMTVSGDSHATKRA